MSLSKESFCRNFELGVDRIRHLSKNFCESLGITVFAYGRVYPHGITSWLTSSPDQDRLLLDSNLLKNEPVIDSAENLQPGMYLHFCDRQFPGSDEFYREREKRYRMDHGMNLVRHQKDFLEFCCFSGHLKQKPLYNLFVNERALFESFMSHFTSQIDRSMEVLLEEGMDLKDLKPDSHRLSESLDTHQRESLITACGWQKLLKLSKREKDCLVKFREGESYPKIGSSLHISHRTVEHYFESIKNKLDIDSRPDLYLATNKLIEFKLV